MKNKDVARIWANSNGMNEVRTANLFVQNGVIYSYGTHFPVAEFIGDKCLINESKYSYTTSRHQSLVRQWIPESMRVYCTTETWHEARAKVKDEVIQRRGYLYNP